MAAPQLALGLDTAPALHPLLHDPFDRSAAVANLVQSGPGRHVPFASKQGVTSMPEPCSIHEMNLFSSTKVVGGTHSSFMTGVTLATPTVRKVPSASLAKTGPPESPAQAVTLPEPTSMEVDVDPTVL